MFMLFFCRMWNKPHPHFSINEAITRLIQAAPTHTHGVGSWTVRSPLSSTGNNPKWSNFVTHKYLVQRSVYSVTRWLRASYWPYVTCEANRFKQLINIFDHFYQKLKLKKPFQENEIKKLCLVLRKLQEGDACAAGCENERFPHICDNK